MAIGSTLVLLQFNQSIVFLDVAGSDDRTWRNTIPRIPDSIERLRVS
jgi:hypothetical protein